MPIPEHNHPWSFAETATTGALKAFDTKGYSQSLTFYVESGPGCTATVQLQTRVGSSSGVYATLSTSNNSTSVVNVVQFLGPLGWVRPYCTAKTTGTLTVRLLGN